MNIRLNEYEISNNNKFVLIAGPCSIESEELVMQVAEKMMEITQKYNIPYVFKSSFDKANRTSINSYRGVGLEKGLEILNKVKSTYNIPIITDIHTPEQANAVSEVVDIIQIPAFLCRQTDLLIAAAKTQKIVNVKKAQFLSAKDMKNVIKKFEECGNEKIMLCERGSCFGYNNLVVDMTGMIEMKKFNKPVIFDGTHSVQKPGGNGDSTGGNREYVKYLSRAAISLGIAGLFIETHPCPDNAKSDGPNMVALHDMETLIKEIKFIDDYVKGDLCSE